MSKVPSVLIIDDDSSVVESLLALMEHQGYKARSADSAESAVLAVREEPTDLALLDLRLGSQSGLDLLPLLKKVRPEMSIIMITAAGTIEDAVEAMRRGADNFITKPVEPARLLTILKKGFETRALRSKNQQLERLSSKSNRILSTHSKSMEQAMTLAGAVAPRETTVLLSGETGSGKGLLARMIHDLSPRKNEPFVELNCAGLQRDLTESELFGHEKGAFTGATERKIGLFEAADDGTLFLDEIGEMELPIQAKLLKVLEQKRFRRVGGIAEIESDVRVIVATHRDLAKDVAEGKFREDLFYRLNIFKIEIPPLRERTEDVIPLATEFLKEFRSSQEPLTLSNEAQRILKSYSWPGNVRELRNVLERTAILFSGGPTIEASHLPNLSSSSQTSTTAEGKATTMEEAEKEFLMLALKTNEYNIKATAEELGISRSTLYRKMERYGISIPDQSA